MGRKMIEEFINEFIAFAKIPSVSLFEKPLYDYILKNFKFDNYEKILNDNYIAFIPKKNNSNTVISIHIDRLGIVYNGNNFVYSNYYGYKLNGEKYKPSLSFGKRFVGEEVIAYNLDGEVIDTGVVNDCWVDDEDNELIFEIEGIETNKLLKPTPIAYKNELIIRNDEIGGQIDNIISVVLAYFLLKENIGYTVLFTTQEEIGKSWQFIFNFLEKQQINNIVIIDTTSIEGLSDFNSTDIVFRVSDDMAKYNDCIVNKFVELAKKKKLRFFLKSASPEGSKIKTITEVGRIIKQSNNRFSGASVQFPTIRYHTNHEAVKIESVKVLYSFLKDIRKIG
jgi:hypothetical protein